MVVAEGAGDAAGKLPLTVDVLVAVNESGPADCAVGVTQGLGATALLVKGLMVL